jgi:hypothetical protein
MALDDVISHHRTTTGLVQRKISDLPIPEAWQGTTGQVGKKETYNLILKLTREYNATPLVTDIESIRRDLGLIKRLRGFIRSYQQNWGDKSSTRNLMHLGRAVLEEKYNLESRESKLDPGSQAIEQRQHEQGQSQYNLGKEKYREGIESKKLAATQRSESESKFLAYADRLVDYCNTIHEMYDSMERREDQLKWKEKVKSASQAQIALGLAAGALGTVVSVATLGAAAPFVMAGAVTLGIGAASAGIKADAATAKMKRTRAYGRGVRKGGVEDVFITGGIQGGMEVGQATGLSGLVNAELGTQLTGASLSGALTGYAGPIATVINVAKGAHRLKALENIPIEAARTEIPWSEMAVQLTTGLQVIKELIAGGEVRPGFGTLYEQVKKKIDETATRIVENVERGG